MAKASYLRTPPLLPDDGSTDEQQQECYEHMSESEKTMDRDLYPVLMFLIQEGPWKKQYTEAAQLNSDLKKASTVVYTILYRMPMTILEHAAIKC